MSTAEHLSETQAQLRNDPHVDRLIERFSALAERAHALLFPKAQQSPDKSGWSRTRRFLYKLSSPFPIELDGGRTGVAVYLGWMLAFAFWGAVYLAVLSFILDAPVAPSPQSNSGIAQQIVTGALAAVAGIIFIPAAYWRWIEFFRDHRFPKWVRMLLALAFGLALSFHHYLFDTVERTRYVDFIYAHVVLSILLYVLLLIPALTYIYMLALYALFRALRLMDTLLKYSISTHQPMPIKVLRNLILEPISPGQEAGGDWRLIDLSVEELRAIRSWSTANREGTDKRLLPTAVVFGVLGVFANTRVFADFAEAVLVFLYKTLVSHPELTLRSERFLVGIGEYAGAGLVLTLVGIFAQQIVSLFANLIVQNVIVEACIVAEYAREQYSRTCSQETRSGKRSRGLWKWFVGLLLGR